MTTSRETVALARLTRHTPEDAYKIAYQAIRSSGLTKSHAAHVARRAWHVAKYRLSLLEKLNGRKKTNP